jgi:FkbM family methyltransferase
MRSLKRLKYKFKNWFHDLKFFIAGQDSLVYRWIALGRYRPKRGSVEDMIDRFSRSKEHFQLIQIGANDGMTHDPVYRFVKRDRWNALLFEPQPSVVERYLRPVYRKYPKVKIVNAAIGYEDGRASIYTISFSQDRWATGLTRFDRELLLDLIRSGRLDRRLKRYGIEGPTDHEDWVSEKQISVRSLSSVVDEYNLDQVDLMMIDTEGFDHEVLKMVNMDRLLPNLIVFEDMHIGQPDYSECVERLRRYGYATHRIGPNTVAWQEELSQFVPWG